LTTPRVKRWTSAALLAGTVATAGATPLPVTPLDVQAATTAVAPLVCPAAPPRRPAPGRPSAPPPEPTELPGEEEVQRALRDEPVPAPGVARGPDGPGPALGRLAPLEPERPLRLAFWGDSHLAAGFFTEELARLLGPVDTLALPRLLPAGFGHAGVRGLVRRACVTGPWRRESAHASAVAARQPGPGLVSLVSQGPGAELAFDLRDAQGEPRHRRVQLLYTPGAAAAVLEVSVDDAAPVAVVLEGGTALAAALELASAGPALSVLRVRVREGTLRLQGLRLGPAQGPAATLEIDLFGYPGATVAGWANASAEGHAPWFAGRRYDLVVLAYGTNETNDPGFRLDEYRGQLSRAVERLRERFPEARCLLIAPGDRGVRVPRKRTRVDLLRHARVHAQVAGVQLEVARAAGCAAWSQQAAMGGPGSAYRWVRQQPPWMASDLIHFTPAGYRELARRLAADLGWTVR
jgi:lysophospholipase L1-like esterase